MSQQPIDGVSGVKRAAPGSQSQVEDLKPGELLVEETGDGDAEAIFKGDGVMTPAKVTARFLQLNPLKDPLMAEFQGSENAAFLGAELALRGHPNNRKLLLSGQSADRGL